VRIHVTNPLCRSNSLERLSFGSFLVRPRSDELSEPVERNKK
jgi:hypothetical protein